MKLKYILLILIILLIGAAGAYWYYFFSGSTVPTISTTDTSGNNGFVPFDRNPSNVPSGSTTPVQSNGNQINSTSTDVAPVARPPRLRLLSSTPVGGYGASTTLPNTKLAVEGTTIIRWIDRGRGNIYEARGNTTSIETLSNTVVPRIVDSQWTGNVGAFVAAMLTPDTKEVELVFGRLRPETATSTTPFALRGSGVQTNLITYAVSPRKDKVFTLVRENNEGVGYISNLDGTSMVQIFSTPLTQVTAEWPEENTIAITTNPSANQNGFLYFINPKTGAWKKILGPLSGLTALVSHDAKYALISSSYGDSNSIKTSIINIGKGTQTELSLRTMASKCVWGNFYKELVYCGIPISLPSGLYPNDWYAGTMSFADNIWQINASSGELKLTSSLTQQAKKPIDAYRMGLDRNDNFLFFINKDDLSLWSLDLVSQQ
jgi:hypothetical protein